MDKDSAELWAKEVSVMGCYPERQAYLKQFNAGEVAKDLWNDPAFTLGIEYGIKIAVAKIFGELKDA